MSNPFFDATIPPLVRGLNVLTGYVDKADAYARSHDMDPVTLIDARLAPDMMSLAGQIQRASDKAKNGVARLSGKGAPAFADTETTFADLRHRIFKTISHLNTVTPEELLDGAASRVELSFQSFSGVMSGEDYLTKILLPDSYFHIAIVHAILRSRSLSVGKADYLGNIG